MNINIFPLVRDDPACAALLASGGTTRFYRWGMAPQNVKYPYAVWQTVGGLPENYLQSRSDMDSVSIQIDVYSQKDDGGAESEQVAEAIRSAIEGNCYVTSWRSEGRDPETKSYRAGFDCDWHIAR